MASTAAAGVPFEATILGYRVQKVQRYSFQRPFIEVYRLWPGWDAWRQDPAAALGPAGKVVLAVQPAKNLLPRRVLVPDFALPTVQARAVLPSTYSREDAVFNVQRASLLIAALAAGATNAFPAALEDRFHQPYREALVPGLHEILKLRAPGLLGCALSGAGPSILVFFERGYESVCDLVRQIFRLHGHESETLFAGVAEHGFEVTEEAE